MQDFSLGLVVLMSFVVMGVTSWDRHRVAAMREAYGIRNVLLTLCLLIHPSINFFTYMLITYMWTIYLSAILNSGFVDGGYTTK